jgi:protein SCO1/2
MIMKLSRTLLPAVGAFALGLSLIAPAASAAKPPAPPTSVGVAVNVPLPDAISKAQFVDQSGAVRTLASFKGQTVFLVPILTLCPDTCPFTTGNLLQLRRTLVSHHDKNIQIVTVSVDPWRDTAKRNAAYAKMIGAKFYIWTETGPTKAPVPPTTDTGTGTGDTNDVLTAFETFFGWGANVVKEDTPASVDWMAPHHALRYDVSHSDGFWVINAAQSVRFESGNAPRFKGTLAKALYKFLNADGKYTASHPTAGGWTPSQALAALSYVIGKQQ